MMRTTGLLLVLCRSRLRLEDVKGEEVAGVPAAAVGNADSTW